MELKRKPLQGVWNIIRFNWHFYVLAGLTILATLVFKQYIPGTIHCLMTGLVVLATIPILLSLIISMYVYDLSGLYRLTWLPNFDHKAILNIHAGFDETSAIIKGKFPKSNLTICDFYNPDKHTEISIKRAREAYPPFRGTIKVQSDKFPFSDESFEFIIAIFSAHEIRDKSERIVFFRELNRITKPMGKILVTEHLRDKNNFLAYSIGFLHFHSKSSWMHTFDLANLTVVKEIKTTPFVTTFILEKNGNTL